MPITLLALIIYARSETRAMLAQTTLFANSHLIVIAQTPLNGKTLNYNPREDTQNRIL